MIKPLLFAALLCCRPASAAQSGDLEFFDFERASLEEIIDIRTQVASRLDFAAREAPGIITVLTREEIAASGARDLADILHLVPGLDLAVDVEGNLGLGVRGNWAHEGKVLLLVDGQVYNEPFFGTPQIERISVEQIERLEIIRGPGSVIYGGSAGLGVIKITTRGPKSLNGARLSIASGLTARGGQRLTRNLAYGRVLPDAAFTAQAYCTENDLSDRRYTDFNGGSYSMKGNSDMRNRSLNIGYSRGGYDLRLIADRQRNRQRDGAMAAALDRPYKRSFDSYFAGLSRELPLSDSLSLTPALNYAYQEPYNGFEPLLYPRLKRVQTLKVAVNAVYAAGSAARLSAGAEASLDSARLNMRTVYAPGSYSFVFDHEKKDYTNTALFVEGVAELPLGLLSAGARYDRHQKFAPAFSPRLAWTKALDKFHFKAICSHAFRAPGIDNLDANPDLKPEKTFVMEAEAGYKPDDQLYLSANFFRIRIKDPIVFYIDNSPANLGQQYGNYGETGTRGFELSARLKEDWGRADITYSHYAAEDNEVDFYNSGGAGALLAFARNKLTLNASLKLRPGLSVNPSATLYAGRRGYYGAGLRRRYDDALLANLYLLRSGLAGGRLELGAGVHNIFNSPYSYLQPYDGGHAPLPMRSRELAVNASYKF